MKQHSSPETAVQSAEKAASSKAMASLLIALSINSKDKLEAAIKTIRLSPTFRFGAGAKRREQYQYPTEEDLRSMNVGDFVLQEISITCLEKTLHTVSLKYYSGVTKTFILGAPPGNAVV